MHFEPATLEVNQIEAKVEKVEHQMHKIKMNLGIVKQIQASRLDFTYHSESENAEKADATVKLQNMQSEHVDKLDSDFVS
jgi:hypothetical protein